MPIRSFPTWRIDATTIDSRSRATAEEADALGNSDGQVTKAETELLAKKYEADGFSSSAEVVRDTWRELERDGVSSVLASIPGACARGVTTGLQSLFSGLFKNVR